MLFECLRCGTFGLTGDAAEEISGQEMLKRHLSSATRQESEYHKPITLRRDNYKMYAEEHGWTSVQQKMRKVLEYLGGKSSFYSQLISLDPTRDYPLFDAVSHVECRALMNELTAKGLVSRGPDVAVIDWSLTMEGWDSLEPVLSGGIPGRCFVAMAFDLELDDAYYQAIKPAITECGYDPVCLKDRLPNDDICDVILAEIRKAQFIVADFTKQKGGVYFEAGFAKALGKEVFWTCRENDFKNLHFDTNHYGHLKWSEPSDLKTHLRDWIIAELGFGPHRRADA